MLLTTQYLEEADELADQIAVIDHGLVVAEGTPAELKARTGGQTLMVRAADQARTGELATIVAQVTGATPEVVSDIGLVTAPASDPALLPAVVRRLDEVGLLAAELAFRLPSLDEVFFTLTGHPAEEQHRRRRAGGMTTLDVATTTAPAREPGALRRRIGAKQGIANALTLAWRNVAQLRHSPEKLLDVTLMPIVFLVLFLYLFGGAVAGSTHAYLELLLPGLVAQIAMFSSMGLGTALCEDIHKGVFDRFRSLPIARSSPLVGAVLGDTVRFCVAMAVLIGFGVALGFRFHTGVLPVLAAFALAYVFYLAICWISVLIGLIAPAPETVQGISFIFLMPLVFGSSILIPRTMTLPGWLQAWVKVNPVTSLADAVRGLTVGGPVATHVLYALAWAAGIVIVAFPLAMRMYRRRV